MKLYYDRKSKDPTYFIQLGIRNGKKTTTKNIKRIGKHSELLLITDDPLSYAKEQVALANKERREGKINMNLKIDFTEKLSYADVINSKSTILNIGYFVLQKIYKDLKISEFIKDIQSNTKATFDCNTINRFVTFSRILNPCSKLAVCDTLDNYYEKPAFQYQHILRFMDILSPHFDEYIEHLFKYSGNIVKRNTSVCYFDCTNFYFEIEQEDEDYIDEVTGEVFSGFRKYGISKQHQPNPLVQMGLFMDGNGIPVSMCINPGSDNEQNCVLPSEKKILKMFKGKPFIYCADAGLGSYDIRRFNSMGSRAFVISQSIKKLSKVLQDAVFDDIDYKKLSDNSDFTVSKMKAFDKKDENNLDLYNDVVYKVINTDKAIDTGLYETVTCKNGKTKTVKAKGLLKQKVIITFSRKYMEYQRYIRNTQIERAKKYLSIHNNDEIKKGPNDVKRFIKRVSKGKSGEKAVDSFVIDTELIAKEEKYDGYYAIATNLDDDAKTILNINSDRYKIEDCFRVLKTDFNTRPINHHLRERIIAHFMMCYTALLIFRLLENKLDKNGVHFTANNILKTLKNMNVTNMQDMFYSAAYTGSQVCTALNAAFDLGLDKKYYEPKELNKKLKKIL